MRDERGLAFLTDKESARALPGHLRLPSFEEVRDDRKTFARAAYLIQLESNPCNARPIVQLHGSKAVVVNPPALPLTTAEFDAVHELPFTKDPHPSYIEKIPAHEMIRFSIQVCRGCFGGCSFCALTLHQGRVVQSRSEKSVLREVSALNGKPGFTGIVSDLGGPTANMYGLRCRSEQARAKCRKLSCLVPEVCPNLQTDHSAQVRLLKLARTIPGIRKILIASGLRFDLALRDPAYLEELVSHHVGGHLKVAPEHNDDGVLRLMRKPRFELFMRFREAFDRISAQAGKEQYIVPYFISGLPGSTHDMMCRLEGWLRKEGWKLQQVQAFIPTPMTLATAMWWSGIDPETKKTVVHVTRDRKSRLLQQALLQSHRHGRPPTRRPRRT